MREAIAVAIYLGSIAYAAWWGANLKRRRKPKRPKGKQSGVVERVRRYL